MNMMGVGETVTTLMRTRLAGTRYEDDCFPGTKRAYIPGSKRGGIELVAGQWRWPPLQSRVWLPVAREDATWLAVLTSLQKENKNISLRVPKSSGPVFLHVPATSDVQEAR